MILKHNENGDMVISHNPGCWYILTICLQLVNFIAGGYKMATTSISSWGPNIYIQLPLLLLIGVPLCYAFTRKSEFYFDSKNKTVTYVLQSFWSEEKGVIPISEITEIIIQSGGTTDSGDVTERLAMVCKKKKIPMSLTYTNVIDFENIKKKINEWLQNNTVA